MNWKKDDPIAIAITALQEKTKEFSPSTYKVHMNAFTYDKTMRFWLTCQNNGTEPADNAELHKMLHVPIGGYHISYDQSIPDWQYELRSIGAIEGTGFVLSIADRMKHQAMRFNDGKLQWHLLDMRSHEGMVRVLMFGSKKYAPDNWRKGLPVHAQYDSLMRHMAAFMAGEDNDPETGLPHLAHAQCNLQFLVHTMANHAERMDDRYKPPTT